MSHVEPDAKEVVSTIQPTTCDTLTETASTGSGSRASSKWSQSMPATGSVESALLAFHHSNIHEQKFAAYVARAVPMAFFLTTIFLSIYGLVWAPQVLLWTCAVLNVWMWLWLVCYALFSLQSTWQSRRTVAAALSKGDSEEAQAAEVTHLIVLPNYKEDESILASTLTAIEQAHGSSTFRIVLAMEDREGPNAKERSERLTERFGDKFARFSTAFHRVGLMQEHLGGSAVPEVPGKCSNLKWAVQQAFDECSADGLDLDRVVLTTADADCIFHPAYFSHVGCDFSRLKVASGEEPCWTIWQAPQLPFRNYTTSPSPSRIWGYVSSVYEVGGVGGLQFGGYHMTFSSYSLPLTLAMAAAPYDGDVIADDHHCYLRCFLYSVYHVAVKQAEFGRRCKGIRPPLQVRPVMLPTKSTSVEADNCVKSWSARFNQAKRHTQGVAELSYMLLGSWRLLRTLPFSAYSITLLVKLFRAILLPFCANMLPVCQSIPFALLTVYWLYHRMELAACPNEVRSRLDNTEFYVCWFAGGFTSPWSPAILPLCLIILASFYMILASFPKGKQTFAASKQNARTDESLWENEDGCIYATCGSKALTILGYVLFDCLIMLPVVMPIYGVIPAILSYWNCLVRGNRFDFVSAAKGAPASQQLLPTAGVELSVPPAKGAPASQQLLPRSKATSVP